MAKPILLEYYSRSRLDHDDGHNNGYIDNLDEVEKSEKLMRGCVRRSVAKNRNINTVKLYKISNLAQS